MKFVRAGISLIPVLGISGGAVLLWLNIGTGGSAIQEADAAALAACAMIGTYTLARSLRRVLDAFKPAG